MRIAGVVLAGGQSTRMGATKATIEIDGIAMGNRIISALRVSGCDPVIVVGGDDGELSALDAEVRPDLYPGEGPVGGIITALRAFGDGPDRVDGVLIVPCDVPALDDSVISPLIDTATVSLRRRTARRGVEDDGVDVVAARTDRVEPMCAVWATSHADAIDQFFADGGRAVHRLLGLLDVHEVEVEARALRNVNTPHDLR